MKVKYMIGNKSVSRDSFLDGANGVREIISTGEFPSLHTDDEFMANRGSLQSQLGEQTADIVKLAQRHGYNPKHSDVYLSSIARFPGDPEAFVSHDSARGKIKKTLEKRGWSCDGSVKVKGRQMEPKQTRLATDLAVEGARSLARANPKAKVGDLIEEAVHVHGAK